MNAARGIAVVVALGATSVPENAYVIGVLRGELPTQHCGLLRQFPRGAGRRLP
jgi:hypothetical protein